MQALRALAASAIVFYHVLHMLVHNAGYAFFIPTIGASGVDLFFLISGFIMVYTNYEAFTQPHAAALFLRRRVIRIVPMYWLCTTGVVLLLAFTPQLFASVVFDWTYVVSSYVFLLSQNSAGNSGTVLQTGWTLCFEVYFYLVFALLLNWPRRYFLLASGGAFLGGVFLGHIGGHVPTWATVATDPIIFEFYLGAIVGFLFVNGIYLPRSLAGSAIVLAIAALAVSESINVGIWTRLICWGIPSAAILFGAISLEQAGLRVPKPFVALGDSSYSLYLVHPFVLPAFGKGWLALHLAERTHPIVPGIFAFACALLVGHVVYLLVEKPVITLLSQTWKAYRPSYS